MKKFLYNYILPYLLYGFIYLLCLTIREENKNPEGEEYFNNRDDRYILTLWHGRIFYLFYHFRNRPDLNLLVSPSEDGDLLANVARLLGYTVIRGSTYKQPIAATRKIIRILRQEGHIIAVADGSRGPCCKAQSGALQIARLTGAPLIPMTYEAKHHVTLKSWDRHIIPLPFTRCTVNFGDPVLIPRDADDAFIKARTQDLEQALKEITASARS